MKQEAKPWVGLVFNCLAVLSLIFAFIFFMRMQEEEGFYQQFRTEGVVSRARVIDMKRDELVRQSSKGRSTRTDIYLINVRFVPKSTVSFTDVPTKVVEAALPVAPRITGDIMQDMNYNGVMFVPKAVYEATRVGDYLTVVSTPYNTGAPELFAQVRDFKAEDYYPPIAFSIAMALVFVAFGLMFGPPAKIGLVGRIIQQANIP